MTTYEHMCGFCNKEFEEVYGMTDPVPTVCSLCGKKGKVQRLVSGGSGKGKVILTGQELKDKIKADAREISKAAVKDERVLRNLIGDEKLQRNIVEREKTYERPRIRTSRKG